MADTLIPDLEPHHFCVSVPDREAAIAWWGEIFGFALDFTFEIPHISARGAFVRRGDLRIEIFEIADSNPVPEDRKLPNTDLQTQGMKHFCFAVADLQKTLETLHGAGVAIVGVARGPGKPMLAEDDPRLAPSDERAPASAIFLQDPWGTLIEIVRAGDFAE